MLEGLGPSVLIVYQIQYAYLICILADIPCDNRPPLLPFLYVASTDIVKENGLNNLA